MNPVTNLTQVTVCNTISRRINKMINYLTIEFRKIFSKIFFVKDL